MTSDARAAEVEYRDVAGWPGYYVGSDGSVWSSRQGQRRQLKPGWSSGYPTVSLSITHSNRVQARVHVLVLNAFVGPRPDGMEACHYNGNRADNRLINLRWGTRAENAADATRHGTARVGEMNGNALLSAEQIPEIRRLSRLGLGPTAIGRRLGVKGQTIGSVLSGRSWAHVPNGAAHE